MIVVKFGGTSVADAAAVERARDIVAARAEQLPIVVVSAAAGTTNALLALATQAARGHLIGAVRAVEDIRVRHLAMCDALLDPAEREVRDDVAALCDEVAALAEALATLGHATPRSLDAVAAIGEQMSSLIVAAAFARAGLPSRHVDAREVMVTSDHFTEAEPVLPAIAERGRERLLPLLRAREIPVLGGYIGATVEGVTTTLGRGGSDYSASLLGAALDATEIQIWTDVDGMLTADPRVVSGAVLIREIRFDEASELASFGARVLHPSTIAPAVRRGIPVFIYNSRNPATSGTRITFDAPRRPVTAVAAKKGVTVVRVSAPRMLLARGFLHAVFETFERYRTSVDVVATSEISVSVTLDEVAQLDELVVALRQLGDVAVERDRAVVAIVGSGIGDRGDCMGRALIALRDLRIHMLSLSASGINVTVVLDGGVADEAVRRLHAEFFAVRA